MNGPRIVLHMGTHKTGSTSIQQTLWQARADGIGLPRGVKANQSDLARLLFEEGDRLEQFRLSRMGGADRAALDKARHEARTRLSRDLERCRAPVFVFSAEDMTAPDFPEEAMARAAAFFGGFSDRIEAVAYARPPLAFMTSAYLQRLRELKPAALDFAPETLWPNYRDRFEKLDTVFGPEAVTLRAFDRATLEGGDVVRDFLGLIDPALAQTIPILRSNDALSLPALSLLYARLAVETGEDAGFTPEETSRLGGLVARRLRPLTGPRLVIDPGVLEPVRDAHAEDLAWMEARLGRALPDAPIGDGVSDPRAMLDIAREALPLTATLPAPARASLPRRLWRRLRQMARA